MGTEGGGPLGAGKDDAERVLLPWLASVGVGRASPQIDNSLPFHGNAYRGSDLFPLFEVPLEFLSHAFELRVALS